MWGNSVQGVGGSNVTMDTGSAGSREPTNAGLIALFFVARVAGPQVGIKPEVVDSLTVLRKSLEALSVILLALSLRRSKVS